jgi:hypothetical protein
MAFSELWPRILLTVSYGTELLTMELAIEERRECGPFFLPAVEILAFDMCFLIA